MRPFDRSSLFGGRKNRIFLLYALLIIGLLTGTASSQRAEPRLAFEIASVKPSKSFYPERGGLFSSGGRYEAIGISLKSVILQAYEIPPAQLIGGPSWLDSDGFDISAKAELGAVAPGLLDPSSLHRLHLMLRSLLEDRFRLSVHRETRQAPLSELVVAPGGFKLQTLKDVDCRVAHPPGTDLGCGAFTKSSRNGSLAGPKVRISDIAEMLSRMLARPVIDKTHIDGYFDLDLRWTVRAENSSESLEGPQPSEHPEARRDQRPAGVDKGDLTIFVAMEQQLGLKLKEKKGPVEVLLVDRVEKPSAN